MIAQILRAATRPIFFIYDFSVRITTYAIRTISRTDNLQHISIARWRLSYSCWSVWYDIKDGYYLRRVLRWIRK